MSDFTAQNWQKTFGELWHFLPAGIQEDLTERPAPSHWIRPKPNIIFLQLVKLLKQKKHDAIFSMISEADVPSDYEGHLAAFGAYVAALRNDSDLASLFLREAHGVDASVLGAIQGIMTGSVDSTPRELATLDERSCSVSSPKKESKVLRVANHIASTDSRKQTRRLRTGQLDEVTIFCSVYSKDPNRYELLEGHRQCLANQSINVHPIYIFECGDKPPTWLDARSIVYPMRLSIYQAWQIGMERSPTKVTGNLNLDDRFLTSGIECLYNRLVSSSGTLVGGEWNIYFERADVDRAIHLASDAKLPETETWPPSQGSPVSLGSGTVCSGGTFGPATLVDKSKFRFCYPTRFKNDELIESIGDSIFWSVLKRMNHKCVRTDQVVGRYLSNPSEQAEFRAHHDHQLLKYGFRATEILDPIFDEYRLASVSAQDFSYEM